MCLPKKKNDIYKTSHWIFGYEMSLYQDEQNVKRKENIHSENRTMKHSEFWLDIMVLHVIMDLARQSAGAYPTRSGELTKK